MSDKRSDISGEIIYFPPQRHLLTVSVLHEVSLPAPPPAQGVQKNKRVRKAPQWEEGKEDKCRPIRLRKRKASADGGMQQKQIWGLAQLKLQGTWMTKQSPPKAKVEIQSRSATTSKLLIQMQMRKHISEGSYFLL